MNVNAFKFRKKPVVIEAYQWKEGDALNLRRNGWPQWLVDAVHCDENWDPIVTPSFEGYATIKTLEGEMRADSGDWIIRGINGELYPCKPDIFAATYESADIDLNAADFSDALMWLKEGKRVQRAGWNGSNQWVELVRNSGLVFRSEHDSTAFSVADGLVLKNAQGIVVQWVPSIGDLMADDWKVVGKNVDEPSYRTVSSDGRETLNFVSNTLPHQRRVIEEYDQLFNRHQDLTKFFDTDLYRSLSVEERNRLKEQSLFMAEYQRVLLERIRAF
ncbi:DUF2829 domain-containing protein [Klebsiella pneumoniae]|uniref:DUF2829 domain-containing protein n=1 Tax=Klebsiella pneumoniae TaxID=573 RepID=UPI000D6466F2|nr:DUF2829 domain-containing protein [Klebsiella pneumoniae]